jgi:hypothetical protein
MGNYIWVENGSRWIRPFSPIILNREVKQYLLLYPFIVSVLISMKYIRQKSFRNLEYMMHPTRAYIYQKSDPKLILTYVRTMCGWCKRYLRRPANPAMASPCCSFYGASKAGQMWRRSPDLCHGALPSSVDGAMEGRCGAVRRGRRNPRSGVGAEGIQISGAVSRIVKYSFCDTHLSGSWTGK